MKEIVVISGKGGTGKTSVTASLAVLAGNDAVVADCDVDASNLALVLGVKKFDEEKKLSVSEKARLDSSKCTGSGRCAEDGLKARREALGRRGPLAAFPSPLRAPP